MKNASKNVIGMNIGGIVDPATVEASAKAIVAVFKAGFDYRMDQDTVRAAIGALPSPDVAGVSVSNCRVEAGES